MEKVAESQCQPGKLPARPALHESQEEIEHTDEYCIFKLHVRPTYDFQQELLWNREELEVLEPLWLREEMAGIIKRMWNRYADENK